GVSGKGCDGQKGPGNGAAFDCGLKSVVFNATNVECDDMLAKCATAAQGDTSVTCQWNGIEIFTQEDVPGICDIFAAPGPQASLIASPSTATAPPEAAAPRRAKGSAAGARGGTLEAAVDTSKR
ncbi:MAG TPA: hypothetical protein VFS00_15720, partial [Polyangiaceae bacterium]|nr:hypothetical protein [Polyangiaceae bacterium]